MHKILNVQNLYLYVLRGVRRVSCPLLKYCVWCTRSASSAAALNCGSGGIFLAKISYLGLNLKQTQSERRIYDSKDEEGGNPFHIWVWRQKKKTLNLTDIKTTFLAGEMPFRSAARWLYKERLESGIFENLWRGHDIWWAPCISLNKAKYDTGAHTGFIGICRQNSCHKYTLRTIR